MNNEIKEILAYFEEYVKIIDMHDSEPTFNWKDLKIVLDYITNLQQDNEMYAQLKDEYEEEIKDLQQENERLKEENNNKAMNDYAHAIDESWYRELYDDYKSRCEKAIEILHSINDTLPLDIILSEIEHSEYILQNGSDSQ